MPEIPAQVFPLGEFIAEELEARGWTPRDFALRIENVRGREIDGALVKAIAIRELEIEIVLACSGNQRCISTEESLKAFARGFGCSWEFLANIQKAYLKSGSHA